VNLHFLELVLVEELRRSDEKVSDECSNRDRDVERDALTALIS